MVGVKRLNPQRVILSYARQLITYLWYQSLDIFRKPLTSLYLRST